MIKQIINLKEFRASKEGRTRVYLLPPHYLSRYPSANISGIRQGFSLAFTSIAHDPPFPGEPLNPTAFTAMADDDDQPISKAVFEEAINKMMGDLGKKVDTEVSTVPQECAHLSTSIKNIQTQLLDKKGRFDTHSPGSSGGFDRNLAPPVHKLRFPKYDGSEDPHHMDPQWRAILPNSRYAGGSEGVDGIILPTRHS